MRTSHSEFEWSHALLGPTPQLHHQVSVTLGHVTSHPDGVGSIKNVGLLEMFIQNNNGKFWASAAAPVELVQVSPRQEVVRERLGVAHTLDAGVHEAGVAEVTEASGSFLCWNWDAKQECKCLLIQ